jgi:hypothetical protein
MYNNRVGYSGYVMGPGYVMGRRPPRYGSRRRGVVGEGAMDTEALRQAIEMANATNAARAPMVQVVQPPDILPANCQVPPTPGFSPALQFRTPGWRGTMLAPGVSAPGQQEIPLPLIGNLGGVFTQGGAATQTFTARTQVPFKPQRMVVNASHLPAVPGGPVTPARLQAQTFVGNRPQQGSLGFVDIESLGAPTAFDMGIDYDQAEPGVEITVQVQLSTALAIVGESIVANIFFKGLALG